jgi:hypothetical protein
MGKGLIIRTVKTASGAKAVQIVRYVHGKRIIVQHIGSAHTEDELTTLYHKAEFVRKQFCFTALMMGKFLEIKIGLSLQRIRDIIWNVHEARIEDTLTGEQITLRTNLKEYHSSGLYEVLKPH